MADINGVLQPTLDPLSSALDLKSSNLSQNSSSIRPANLPLQRGPRYKAYAELRESKLRAKMEKQQQQQPHEPISTLTPPKKQVTFQVTASVNRRKETSMVARSVPDFSAALRKENRRPVSTVEMTPPPSKASKLSKLGGSKSASGGEKRGGGGLMVRKSYASVEELKGLSSGVASAINGEGRGGARIGRGTHKTVLGSRQY